MKKAILLVLGLGLSPWVWGQTRGLFVPTSNGQTEPAAQEKRIALVIGNQTYSGGGWQRLKNPVNDANLMAATLRNVGFEVLTLTNASKEQMLSGITQLVGKVSGKQTVALVFYAGHGVEAEQKNWLVPVNDATACRDEISMNCISLDWIHSKLRNAGAAFNLIISDACRNNTLPFTCASSGRDGSQTGFVEFKAKGSCIAFSTAPNATASDGQGSNSPYTAALARAIGKEGLSVEAVFKQVSRELDPLGQEPWVHNAFSGEFYFKMPVPPAVVVAPTVQLTPAYPPPAPRVEPAKPVVPANMLLIADPTSAYKMGNLFDAKEGSSDETTHSVTLKPFVMDKYETTFAEYDAFCEATKREKPSDAGDGRDKRPVINVSWFDACEYANWRSLQAGKTPCYTISGENVTCNWNANGYRLPTEAEWEYAASWNPNTNQKTRFGNGKDIADPAEMNFNGRKDYKKNFSKEGEYRQKTVPVGSFAPNGQGLYDMAGNVWEWCWDWYATYDNSTGKPINNPTDAAKGSNRVLRGGSWIDNPEYCRATRRFNHAPTNRISNIGFRLVALL